MSFAALAQAPFPARPVTLISAMPSLQGFVTDGKQRLIAVTTATRSSLAPDVATIAETSIPGFDLAPYIGLAGPAGIPVALANRIAADVADAVREPAMTERLRGLGIDVVAGGPREFAQQLAMDKARVEKVVKQANIQAE